MGRLDTEVVIGGGVNLLLGYNTTWTPSSPIGFPFEPAPINGLTTVPINVDETKPSKWDFKIEFFSSPLSLLDSLYDYKLAHSSNGIHAGAGALIGYSDKALTAIGSRLGVSLACTSSCSNHSTNPYFTSSGHSTSGSGYSTSTPGSAPSSPSSPNSPSGKVPCVACSGGYALCRLRRVLTRVSHPKVKSAGSEQFRHDVMRLPEGHPNMDKADAIIGFVEKYGTHIVGDVTVGDTIYQVFSYSNNYFNLIREIHSDTIKHPLSGPRSQYFSQYTKKMDGNSGGWALQIGKLHIASEDPIFAAQVKSGLWKDIRIADNSIFQYWENPETNNIVNNEMKKKNVPVGLTFINIKAFFEKDVLCWRPILKAAWYTRYGSLIRPFFTEVVEPQPILDTFKAPSLPVSPSICSPRMDLYCERLRLEDIRDLKGTQVVKSVVILSNVIQVNGKVSIPGDHIVIIAQYVISMVTSDQVPEIVISDPAFESILLFVNKFIGTVCFSTLSGKRKVVQGGHVVFNLIGTSVKLMPLYPTTPFPRSLLDACVSGFPFSERLSILIDHSIQQIIWILLRRNDEDNTSSLVSEYLKWVSGLITEEDNVNEALMRSKVSAMNLIIRAHLPSLYLRRFLPYTTYEEIKEVVATIAEVSDWYSTSVTEAERILESNRQLSENITVKSDATKLKSLIKEGLGQSVRSCARAHSALADSFYKFVDCLMPSFRKSEDDINLLSDLVEQQRVVVQERVTAYKSANATWQDRNILSFLFNTVGSIFSLQSPTNFLPPSYEFFNDVGGFMATIQKIKKFAECLAAVENMRKTTSTFKNLSLFAKILAQIEPLSCNSLSKLEWQNFQSLIGEIIPVNTEEGIKLKSSYSILISRGQAYFQSLSDRANIMNIIDDNEEMKRVAGRILGPFESKEAKELESDRLDVVSLTNALSFIYSRSCSLLSIVAFIQSQSIIYEFNAIPTSFKPENGLINLLYCIKQQSLTALEPVNPPPGVLPPVTISVDVATTKITEGNQFTFSVSLANSQFWAYSLVRISKITASIIGIDSTDSGKYDLLVRYSGNPFFDRDINRNPQMYYTVARNYEFRYNIKTGYCESGSSEELSKITPFSDWSVSLPQVFNNLGMKFIGKKVQIKLTFEGQLLKEQQTLPRPTSITRGKAFMSPIRSASGDSPLSSISPLSPLSPLSPVLSLPVSPSLSSSLSSSLTSSLSSSGGNIGNNGSFDQPTLNSLVNFVAGRDVMGGWDAVFAAEIETVNSILCAQFFEKIKNTKKGERTERNEKHEKSEDGEKDEKFENGGEFEEGNEEEDSNGEYVAKFVPRTLKCEFAMEGKNGARFVTQIDLQLSHAELSVIPFVSNSVHVKIKILSGSHSSYFVTSRGEREEFDGPTHMEMGNILEADVQLKYIHEKNGDSLVVLDMKSGHWIMNGNAYSEFDPKLKEYINKAFASESYYYELARISNPKNSSNSKDPKIYEYSKNSENLKNSKNTEDDLVPREFRVSFSESVSGVKTMLLFISTSNTRPQSVKAFNLNETLPIGYEVALFINNRILTSRILSDAFSKNSKFQIRPFVISHEDDSSKIESVRVTSGSIKHKVVFDDNDNNNDNNENNEEDANNYENREGDYENNNNNNKNNNRKMRIGKKGIIKVDFSGLTISPTNLGLAVSLTKTFEQTVEVAIYDGEDYVWTPKYLPITMRVNGLAPLAVSVSNSTQLSLSFSPAALSIDSHFREDSCNFKKLFTQVSNDVQAKLIDVFSKLRFDDLSKLALDGIKLPGGKYMKFSNVVTPGVLLLLGRLDS